jgi:hypothetical protein
MGQGILCGNGSRDAADFAMMFIAFNRAESRSADGRPGGNAIPGTAAGTTLSGH